MDYLNDYTNQLETGQPITNDEQMFVDNEIANLRFP
jgi:ribosome assembly protein YihI (activator of Der GTPase)